MSESRCFFYPVLFFGVIVVSLTFAPVRQFDFVRWDDDINLTQNPLLTEPWSLGLAGKLFTADQAMRFKPVYWLCCRLVYALAGFNPAVWHLFALGLHVLALVLLAVVLRRVLALANPHASWRVDLYAILGATVWAVHPLRAETVAWATASTYPLTGVWLLASFICILQSYRVRHGRWGWLCVAWILAVLGYGSYPVGVTYGIWLVVFDLWMNHRGLAPDEPPQAKWWLKHALFLLPAILAVGITIWTRYHAPGIFSTAPDITTLGLPLRLLVALGTLSALAWQLIWPGELTPNLPPLNLLESGLWIMSGAIVAGLVILAGWRWRKAFPGFTLIVFGFLALSIPCLGLTERPNWPVDRYSYLVHMILVGGIAAGLSRGTKRATAVFAGITVLALGGEISMTQRQLLIWQDSDHLFAHMEGHTDFDDNPRQKAHVYILWANHLAARGENEGAAQKYNQAQEIYLDAIKMALTREDFTEALALLSHQEHHFGLTPVYQREKGAWLLHLGRPHEAMPELQAALISLPDDERTQVLWREAESRLAAKAK